MFWNEECDKAERKIEFLSQKKSELIKKFHEDIVAIEQEINDLKNSMIKEIIKEEQRRDDDGTHNDI